jgi:hypothetical protein
MLFEINLALPQFVSISDYTFSGFGSHGTYVQQRKLQVWRFKTLLRHILNATNIKKYINSKSAQRTMLRTQYEWWNERRTI